MCVCVCVRVCVIRVYYIRHIVWDCTLVTKMAFDGDGFVLGVFSKEMATGQKHKNKRRMTK